MLDHKRALKSIVHFSPSQGVAGILFLVLFVALGVAASVGYARLNVLSSEIEALRAEASSTTEFLKENIATTHSSLSSMIRGEQKKVSSISGTVNTLEKLSRTDPELLQKYSKVFFLNEHYVPERVVEIPEKYTYDKERTYQVHAGVWPRLEELLRLAERDNIELYVFSAYRPFVEQGALKGQYTVTYGAGTANKFSADQGYSEHQLGTTLDFITEGINTSLNGFEKTKAYDWLKNNAFRYGFTLSYPEGNAYYVFEPWHWRFVGVELATQLRNSNRSFYDLDQREIDTYLVSFFD